MDVIIMTEEVQTYFNGPWIKAPKQVKLSVTLVDPQVFAKTELVMGMRKYYFPGSSASHLFGICFRVLILNIYTLDETIPADLG